MRVGLISCDHYNKYSFLLLANTVVFSLFGWENRDPSRIILLCSLQAVDEVVDGEKAGLPSRVRAALLGEQGKALSSDACPSCPREPPGGDTAQTIYVNPLDPDEYSPILSCGHITSQREPGILVCPDPLCPFHKEPAGVSKTARSQIVQKHSSGHTSVWRPALLSSEGSREESAQNKTRLKPLSSSRSDVSVPKSSKRTPLLKRKLYKQSTHPKSSKPIGNRGCLPLSGASSSDCLVLTPQGGGGSASGAGNRTGVGGRFKRPFGARTHERMTSSNQTPANYQRISNSRSGRNSLLHPFPRDRGFLTFTFQFH